MVPSGRLVFRQPLRWASHTAWAPGGPCRLSGVQSDDACGALRPAIPPAVHSPVLAGFAVPPLPLPTLLRCFCCDAWLGFVLVLSWSPVAFAGQGRGRCMCTLKSYRGLFWPVAGSPPAGWTLMVGQPLAGVGRSCLSSVGPMMAFGLEGLRQGAP